MTYGGSAREKTQGGACVLRAAGRISDEGQVDQQALYHSRESGQTSATQGINETCPAPWRDAMARPVLRTRGRVRRKREAR